MHKLQLDPKISKKCGEAIVISGYRRSGTTILGNIIHSFKNVEYAHEPPILYSLFSLINDLDEDSWRLLYETYLYEDLLVNTLAGRAINCNLVDDSSIYKVKTLDEVEERLNKSLRKAEAERLALNRQIAFKSPDIVPFLPQLKQYYTNTKIVIMIRDAVSLFNSMLKKGWYSERTLREANLIIPNRFVRGLRIPYWVDPKDDELWYEMDEINRIAYYYIRIGKLIQEIPESIIINYYHLIENPEKTVATLADRISCRFGERTKEIIDTIQFQAKDRDLNILNKLDSSTREQVKFFSNLS